MSLKIDRLQLEIVINNDQARKSLRALEDEARQLKKDLRKVPEGSDEWKKIDSRLKSIQIQHDKLIDKLGIEKLTIKELAQRQRELNAIMQNLNPSTKAYKDLEQQLIAIKNRQSQLRGSAAKTNMSLKKLAGSFNHYFAMVSAGVATLTGVFLSAREWVKGLVGLDDQLANVMKTTGLTRKEVRELHGEFKYLNTRTARHELMLLAEQAGRLGKKSKKDVMDFVEVANQIKVALGDDLGGEAEVAIREVGKLTNIYKVGEKYGTDFRKSMLMMGSAINEVSANSQAQAPFLIETLKRMGGIADQAGISAQNIIGYGSALDQLGQRQETSATALSKVILNMFKDVDTYAQLAMMSSEEFFELLNTDANEALLKVLEGLNGNSEGLTVMAQKLDGLGLDGSRAVQVLAALASNTELVRNEQSLANTALEEGTSLTKEYNVKNSNMAGNLEKVGRYLRAMFINSDINKGLEKFVGIFAKMVEIPMAEKLRKDQTEVNTLIRSVASLNEKSEIRGRLFKKLQEQYPDYFKNLNSETTKNEDLFKILSKINDEYRTKIKLSVYEDQLLANEERSKQVFIDQENVVTRINDLYDKYIKNKKEGASLDEQIRALRDEDYDMTVLWGEANADLYNTMVSASDYESIRRGSAIKAAEEYDSLMSEQIELEKEYQNIFEKRMNLSPGPGKSNKPSTEINDNNSSEKETQTIKTLKDELEKLKQARENINIHDKVALDLNAQKISALEKLIEKYQIIQKEPLLGPADDTEFQNWMKQFEQRKQALQSYRADNLEDIQKAFEAETILRETNQNNALALLGNDQIARQELKDKYNKEELIRQTLHLNEVSRLLEEQLQTGGIDGLNIEDAMLTDEEKELLIEKLAEVKLSLSGLNDELAVIRSDEDEEAFDLFGMTEEQWDGMFEKFAMAMDLVNQLGNIWTSVNNKKTAEENQAMKQYEKDIAKRKSKLSEEYQNKEISEEAYHNKVQALDEKLDKEKARLEYEQAKRARTAAIFQIITNTAMAIMRIWADVPKADYGAATYIMTAIAAAVGIAQLATLPPLPSYAEGNYQEVFTQSGKKYRAKVAPKNHKSGLYNEPTYVPGFGIFGETGTADPELVFNPEDTQSIMNTPALIDAINQTLGGVNQFAGGNAREVIRENNTVTETFSDPVMLALLEKISQQLDKPAQAVLVADEDYIRIHKEKVGEYDAFQKRVG